MNQETNRGHVHMPLSAPFHLIIPSRGRCGPVIAVSKDPTAAAAAPDQG